MIITDIGIVDIISRKVLVERNDRCSCQNGVKCENCEAWDRKRKKVKKPVVNVSDIERRRDEAAVELAKATAAGNKEKARALWCKVRYLKMKLKQIAKAAEQYDRTVEDTASAL